MKISKNKDKIAGNQSNISHMIRTMLNKTPAKAFTPPAEKKIGRRKKEEKRWSFVEEVNE